VLPLWLNLICGAGAGSAASWVTSPMDLVKLRMQVDRAAAVAVAAKQGGDSSAKSGAVDAFGFGYKGLPSGMLQLAREEGITALWKGSVARMAFFAPSAAINISAFEWIKARLQSAEF
jgi:hypothetical protein